MLLQETSLPPYSCQSRLPPSAYPSQSCVVFISPVLCGPWPRVLLGLSNSSARKLFFWVIQAHLSQANHQLGLHSPSNLVQQHQYSQPPILTKFQPIEVVTLGSKFIELALYKWFVIQFSNHRYQVCLTSIHFWGTYHREEFFIFLNYISFDLLQRYYKEYNNQKRTLQIETLSKKL